MKHNCCAMTLKRYEVVLWPWDWLVRRSTDATGLPVKRPLNRGLSLALDE